MVVILHIIKQKTKKYFVHSLCFFFVDKKSKFDSHTHTRILIFFVLKCRETIKLTGQVFWRKHVPTASTGCSINRQNIICVDFTKFN